MASITPDSTLSGVQSEAPSVHRSAIEDDSLSLNNDNEVLESEKTSNNSPIIEDIPSETPQSESISGSVHVSNAQHEVEQGQEHLTDLEKALNLRDKVDSLVRRTIQTKNSCERLENDNKYLQDYVANLMNSGELLTRRA